MSKIDVNGVEAGRDGTRSNRASELLREFSIPEPDLDHIVQLIDNEPTLAAEVLRRSNSVVFAGNHPTRDVFEAITRIGILEVRNAVLAVTDSLHF